MTMEIREADYNSDMELVRELFLEYNRFIDVDLAFQGFIDELAGLPGPYSPPTGCIFLGFYGGHPAGCVALKKIAHNTCEMKRLYVKPEFQGKGIGRKLAESIIDKAAEAKYTVMKLDTLESLESALFLYKSLGFRETTPYAINPLEGALFFELKLGNAE
jgi:putative acetyltransferase